MAIKTANELAAMCKKVATNYKTLYVLGCFGAPLTSENKNRYIAAQSYNKKSTRLTKINAATADTFGFDCVCLIKSILWGWTGNKNHKYGGAEYESNGVPDIDESAMIAACSGVTTNFTNIQIGEVVWTTGHIGVYIGDGLAVESTPNWKDGVQITAVHNIGKKAGYNGRVWKKHGKLPYVKYSDTKISNNTEDKDMKLPTLRKGNKGSSVKALQLLLIGNGCSCGGYGADGDFGTKTAEAVMEYQKKNKLAVDGVVGPLTWSKLLGIG